MLRSICAGALLATCGLMVPAREALMPRFDAIILRMMSTDSPADGKSAFQMVRARCCKSFTSRGYFLKHLGQGLRLFIENHSSCPIFCHRYLTESQRFLKGSLQFA